MPTKGALMGLRGVDNTLWGGRGGTAEGMRHRRGWWHRERQSRGLEEGLGK